MFVRGYDIHTAVQEAVSKVTPISRTIAKNVNFGIVYSGGDAKAIAYTTGLPLQTVEEIVAAYFKQAPGVKAYLEDIYARVKRDGYIQTIFGRRRRFPLITPDTWHSIKNEAANFECQSVASDFTQRAVLKLAQSKLCQVILSVHDSIIVRCREEDVAEAKKELEAVMVEIPTQYYKLAPYRVDIAVGYTWGDMK
jgi:DNA polymerase-1